MNRYFGLLFIAVLSFISCETVVELDVPYEKPKLVVNGFFNPDSTFRISLHQSRFVLDKGDFKTVSGAKIVLYDEAGQKLAQLQEDTSGIYEAAIKPKAGQIYRIEVSKAGFETVSAKDTVPAEPARVTKYEVTSVNEQHDSFSLSIWIDDLKGADFYELYAVKTSTIYPDSGEVSVYKNYMYFHSNDPVFEDYVNGDFLFFDDKLFDGEDVKLSFSVSGDYVECVNLCREEESVTLYLRKVSKAYYRYKKTAALQQEVGDNPFTEPVSVYGNIKNGFGIFAGFRTSEIVIEVPEE